MRTRVYAAAVAAFLLLAGADCGSPKMTDLQRDQAVRCEQHGKGFWYQPVGVNAGICHPPGDPKPRR
jgi:hypothetical protein